MTQQHEQEAREDAARAVNDALLGLPWIDRVSALCCSLVVHEPESVLCLSTLICVALTLARHLPADEQTAVRWHLQSAIEELQAKWN